MRECVADFRGGEGLGMVGMVGGGLQGLISEYLRTTGRGRFWNNPG